MFELIEILGLVLIIALHELGHALSGSLINRKVTFMIYKGNPATKVTGPKMNNNEYLFVYSSGLLITLACFNIIVPLFHYDLVGYLGLCTALALLDLFQIYKCIHI